MRSTLGEGNVIARSEGEPLAKESRWQRLRRHPLGRRLPLLLGVLLGLWLWKGGFGALPTSRELVWQLPESAPALKSVEVQLWENGALLKREQQAWGPGHGRDLVQKLNLKSGDYQARAFLFREGAEQPEAISRGLHLDSEETVVIPLH